MSLSLRAGFALLATTAALAGCSTAPTITVPNPLSVFNGAFEAPRVAAARPAYTAPAGRYEQVDAASYGAIVQDYGTGSSYGAVDQGYSLPSIDTGAYASGGIGSSYSAAPSFQSGTYTLGSDTASVQAPSYADGYSTGVPTFGTLASPAPSYSTARPAMSQPVMETASYVQETTTYSEPMTAAPAYTRSYGTQGFGAQSYGSAQPVRASGTTYDLTAPTMMDGIDPAAGLTIDSTGTNTYTAPAATMGGSFQVTTPTLDSGVATYSATPAISNGGTFTY